MIKRRKPPKFNSREETRVRSEAHLQWVRGHECAVKGRYAVCDMDDGSRLQDTYPHQCGGSVRAAHVRIGGNGGTGLKPGDDKTVPLCDAAHGEQHNDGERTFWARYLIDPHKLAAELWAKSPARIKLAARLSRTKQINGGNP